MARSSDVENFAHVSHLVKFDVARLVLGSMVAVKLPKPPWSHHPSRENLIKDNILSWTTPHENSGISAEFFGQEQAEIRSFEASYLQLCAKDRDSSRLPNLLPRTQPSSSPLKPEFNEVSRSCASRLQASSHAPRVAAAPRHRRSPAHCCRRQDKNCASLSAKDRDSSHLPNLPPRTQPSSSPLFCPGERYSQAVKSRAARKRLRGDRHALGGEVL